MSRFPGTLKQAVSGWSVTQVSVLLTVLALALWAVSLVSLRLEIGHFGLVSGFPAIFFVSLAILTLAAVLLWVSPEKHHKLLFLQLMVLIVAVWLIPTLIGTRPYFRDAFQLLQHLDGIAADEIIIIDNYFDWPGAFFVFSMLGKLGSVSLNSVMNISSFIMLLLYLPPLYVFLRNILGDSRPNLCWAGLWIFSLASWVPEGYFNPQGVAYLLFLLLLALLTTPGFWKKGRRWLPLTLSVAVVGAAIVVTHFLTTALALGALTLAAIARRSPRTIPVILVIAALAVFWNVAVTGRVDTELTRAPLVESSLVETPGSVSSGEATEDGLLNFDIVGMAERQIRNRVGSGSQSHVDVSRVRVAFSGLIALLAVAGVTCLLVKKERRTAVLIMALAAVPFLMMPVSGRIYAAVYSERMYFYLVPIMAASIIFLLGRKKWLPTSLHWAIWTIAIPLTIIAQHGNQAMDYWSPGYLEGRSYASQVLAPGVDPFAGLAMVTLGDDGTVTADASLSEYGRYFAISRHDDDIYTFLQDRPKFVDGVWEWLRSSTEYELIYANPEFSLYVSTRAD